MEEFIDIVTNEGIPTGKYCPKSEIHSKGHYHNTVHIWFYTAKGQILLAQRSASKTICPLLWDVSVAGHVDAGESVEKAAMREVKEEINLDITVNELEKIGVFECFQSYPNGIMDNEFHYTFIVELHKDLNSLIPQEDEVEDLKLVTINEFSEILETIGSHMHFVPSNKAYYQLVLEAILKRINKREPY